MRIVSGLLAIFFSVSASSAGPLVTMPNSDHYYGAFVNTQQYVVSYTSSMDQRALLTTDLMGSTPSDWSAGVSAVQNAFPSMVVGAYHSSRDSEDATTRAQVYPPRAVPFEGLTSGQILYTSGSENVVDYNQIAARSYLVSHLVSDVEATGMPLAYLDNVSSDEQGFPISWSTTMSAISDVVNALHPQGVRVVLNAAWVPGLTTTTNVNALINSGADGVSLEESFLDPQVRSSVANIQIAISQYRTLLNSGITVILIPVAGSDPSDTQDVEGHVQAAYGLMFRKPGDKLFVAQAYWQATPDWVTWTDRLGRPLADASVTQTPQNQIVLSRIFSNGTASLNATTRDVSLVFGTPSPTPTQSPTPLPPQNLRFGH